MTVLAENLRRARSGHPCLVVVSGETGVGKTRLVTEFLRHEGPVALVGACVPVAGEALPFAALAQGLRRLDGRDRTAVGSSAQLSRLLPPDRTLGPAGDPRDDGTAAATDVFDQLRLFQAVLALLDHLGRQHGGVVWVVEDLHWADRATLDLLRFVATNLVRESVLLVLTYRLDEVTRHSPMHAWLAELRRLPRVEALPLARLGRDDATTLVRALTPAAADPALVASIVTRADGNPLFTQHLVWQSVDADGPLPEALSDLLSCRLATLPTRTRALIDAACVLARPVPVELLAATLSDDSVGPSIRSGSDLARVEDALRPALENHVLRVSGEGLVEFRHPAFREVAYAEQPATRRVGLHKAAARALLSGIAGGESTPGEVARHWQLAGDLPHALESAIAAGYAAEGIPAFADAYTNFVRALELAQVLDVKIDRVDVMRRAARAARLLGDAAEAVRLLGCALDLATDSAVRAALLEEVAHAHLMAGRGPEAEAALREALELLPPGEESHLVATVYAGLGLLTATWSRHEEAELAARRALHVARAVGARRQEGRAHNALGVVACARGEHDAAVRHLRLALDIGVEGADPDDICDAYVDLTHVLAMAGRDEEAIHVARQGVEVITHLGLARQTGTLLMANLADLLDTLGRYAEAQIVVDRAMRLDPRGIVAAPTLLRAAHLATVRGDLSDAATHVARARGIVEAEDAPAAWVREVAQVSAEVELWAGRPRAAFDRVLEGLHPLITIDDHACSWLLCLGLRALGDLAVTHRSPGARAERDQLLDRLLGHCVTYRDQVLPGDPPEMSAWIATADAESARASEQPDPQLWAHAGMRWDQVSGRPFEAAYARWREAEAQLGRGVDERAISALRAADSRARSWGIVPLIEEVSLLARWYRVPLLPEPVRQEADSVEASIEDYHLTPREREVLASLASGRTNSEIAAHLGISIKTASVHVSSILRKLDVSSRQDAARLAHLLRHRP